jgi:hypothetical protein
MASPVLTRHPPRSVPSFRNPLGVFRMAEAARDVLLGKSWNSPPKLRVARTTPAKKPVSW